MKIKFLSLIVFTFLLFTVPVYCQRDINSFSDKLFDLRREYKYEEAIADLNNLIEASPNDPKLYIKRAEFFGLQNKFNEAIADVNKAINLATTDALSYIERAKYFNSIKNNRAVLKDVQTAVSLVPDKSFILQGGTKELSRNGQYEESIKIADFYIAENSSNAWLKYSAYKIRSEAKFALKDYSGALEDSLKSIELLSFNGDEENNLRAQSEIGNLSQFYIISAVTRERLNNDKRIFDYYSQIFDVLGRKVEESVKNFRQTETFRRLKPGERFHLYQVDKLRALMINCAELYAERGQPEKGVQLFDKIINFDFEPNEPKYINYWLRVNFYKKIGKYQEAINDLTSVISNMEKPGGEVFMQRGDLYVLTSQFDQAIADYETAKIINPKLAADANEKIAATKQKILGKSNQTK